MHGEVELLVPAGMTPVQALRAATSVTARRFGLDDRGLITAGRQADLLMVQGDPQSTSRRHYPSPGFGAEAKNSTGKARRQELACASAADVTA